MSHGGGSGGPFVLRTFSFGLPGEIFQSIISSTPFSSDEVNAASLYPLLISIVLTELSMTRSGEIDRATQIWSNSFVSSATSSALIVFLTLSRDRPAFSASAL